MFNRQQNGHYTFNIYFYRNAAQQIEIKFKLLTSLFKNDEYLEPPFDLHQPFMSNKWLDDFRAGMNSVLEVVLPLVPQVQHHTNEKVDRLVIDNKFMTHHFIYHTLSTSAQVVLNWIGCLINYFSINQRNIDAIHFLQGENEIENDDIQDCKYTAFSEFLKNILKLKSEDPQDVYGPMMTALEKIYVHSSREKLPTTLAYEYMKAKTRLDLIFPGVAEKIHDTTLSAAKKEAFLIVLGESLIEKNQQTEFSFVLRSLNYVAIKSLYEKLLDKRSLSGERYHFNYTEWYVLSHADIYLRDDGCISIINLHKNKGYINWYTEDKPYEGEFQKEFDYLFELMSLKLRSDSDYQNELIFTLQSSQEILIPLGLGITERSIKEAMYKKNYWRFFGNDKKSKYIAERMG